MPLNPDSLKDSVDGRGHKDDAERQSLDDTVDNFQLQDVVVSKIGTQYS